jgi:hypothetical protein
MISNATTFRRMTAGLCLILAPLLMLISDLLGTRAPVGLDELLDRISASALANEFAIGLAVCGFALMIPAIIGIVHLLRHRSVVLGHIGGTMLVFGMIAFSFVAGTETILYIAGSDATISRDAVFAINDRIGASIVYNIINLTEVFGYLFGSLILAVGLFRAKAVPRLLPILLAVGILGRFTVTSYYFGVIISDALYLVAFASMGMIVLRQTDEEWGRPPERAVR